MNTEDLSGSATMSEIAKYYKVSARTMQRRLLPYRSFFTGGRCKRYYYENELQFIKKIFGERQLRQITSPVADIPQ